jgi:oxygen-dependent protoporphyrinogen oxidase
VRDLAPQAAQGLAAIPYAPIAIVATAYRRADIADPLAGFGFLVPRRERRKILGCLFSSSMFEGRAPEAARC